MISFDPRNNPVGKQIGISTILQKRKLQPEEIRDLPKVTPVKWPNED